MITTAKVKSWFIEAGKRILKVSQFGTKTAVQAAPFGDDANPLKNMTALFAETGVNGQPYIIGYINKDHLAQEGEKRIYSKKPDGSAATFIWLKNDGTMQLGGTTYTACRYQPLQTAFTAHQTALNAELAKIAAAIGSLGGAYAVVPLNTDISQTESKDIKMK